MATMEMEKIEMDIPKDILFAMREVKNFEEIKKKMKTALALFLFQERSISLGKAVELAETSRVKFMKILREHHLPAYEYSGKDFGMDKEAVNGYCKGIKK
ncbi:MAG: UPF0175 family protein [bacterium]